MKEDKDKNAFTEVDEIIKNLSEDLKNKIPDQFIKFIKENKNENYVFKFDKNKQIHEQNLSEETKTILTIIYRDFLCSKEEKEELNKILKDNEVEFQEEIKEKYDVKNIFANKNVNKGTISVEKKNQTMELDECKERVFEKIFRKIISIFKLKHN